MYPLFHIVLNILNENKSIEEKADDLSLDTDDSKRVRISHLCSLD